MVDGAHAFIRAYATRRPKPPGMPGLYLSWRRRTISAIQTGANGDVQPGLFREGLCPVIGGSSP